ncbi:hypothetical protein ABTY51_48090, partial [Streptomyces sp. NPDC094472]
MLLRLAYLAATNALAFLWLLPMSDREKDVEILVLRHQLLVLQRRVGKPTFTDSDRAILAVCRSETHPSCSRVVWRAITVCWNPVRVIVSLVYQMTRKLLRVPAVLLRRDTAKNAE